MKRAHETAYRTGHQMGRERETPRPGGPKLLGVGDVRALATRFGIRPSKQRGQNFVTDANTIRRIVRAAGVAATDVVLEIGPGLGSLTLGLLEIAQHVVAVEVDPALAEALPSTIASHAPDRAGQLTVVQADALRLPGAEVRAAAESPRADRDRAGPGVLVANLPYNVAVPVLLHTLEQLPELRHGLVLVQLEVAERLAAGPGGKVYGVPSAKMAWYAETRQAGLIGRSVFWPQPRVDSGLVAFSRRQPPPTAARREQVFAVVDAAFAQRRKTLRAALAGLFGSPDRAGAALRAAGVDASDRGERLGIAEFARIAEHLPPGTSVRTGQGEGHGPESPGGSRASGARS